MIVFTEILNSVQNSLHKCKEKGKVLVPFFVFTLLQSSLQYKYKEN